MKRQIPRTTASWLKEIKLAIADAADAEEVEDMRNNDIRQCTRDLLLMERARGWLLEEGS